MGDRPSLPPHRRFRRYLPHSFAAGQAKRHERCKHRGRQAAKKELSPPRSSFRRPLSKGADSMRTFFLVAAATIALVSATAIAQNASDTDTKVNPTTNPPADG